MCAQMRRDATSAVFPQVKPCAVDLQVCRGVLRCYVALAHRLAHNSTLDAVRQRGTLSDVIEYTESERFGIRFRGGTLTELRRIAESETEGNVSFLVRRLVDEALAARAARTTTRRAQT